MESSSIGTLVVDTLENVKFTTERPVEGINLPDRGPGTTSLRHMTNIESVSGRTTSISDEMQRAATVDTYTATCSL